MADKFIIAGTPEEAVGSKSKDNVYMAGGTEVMRLGSSVSADSFISIRRIPEMHSIEADGNTVSAGAACTFQELLQTLNDPNTNTPTDINISALAENFRGQLRWHVAEG